MPHTNHSSKRTCLLPTRTQCEISRNCVSLSKSACMLHGCLSACCELGVLHCVPLSKVHAWSLCVCVCVCARACVCVCVCVSQVPLADVFNHKASIVLASHQYEVAESSESDTDNDAHSHSDTSDTSDTHAHSHSDSEAHSHSDGGDSATTEGSSGHESGSEPEDQPRAANTGRKRGAQNGHAKDNEPGKVAKAGTAKRVNGVGTEHDDPDMPQAAANGTAVSADAGANGAKGGKKRGRSVKEGSTDVPDGEATEERVRVCVGHDEPHSYTRHGVDLRLDMAVVDGEDTGMYTHTHTHTHKPLHMEVVYGRVGGHCGWEETHAHTHAHARARARTQTNTHEDTLTHH